ncbi:hypothetical protein [Pedobacter psychrodurus]|uniref:hypothetical protein n=1 Tax=Pedobacter psychrodurus TaxID=2530456 RepID=UPI002931208A|nr:hypothetical protein [Pedobacter psychrodurus]
MLIKRTASTLLFVCCAAYLAYAQQVQPSNRDKNEVKEFKIDTLNLDKLMFEMEKELRLTVDPKPKIETGLRKYLIKRMEWTEFKHREPEEWVAGSNNRLFDFSQNLEKILDEDQIDRFWAMKPLDKDDNIWWNIFVVY